MTTTTTTTTTTVATTSTKESLENSDGHSDDEKLLSAPIELLSEFLSALMLRDYETALDHCKTILQYEPENQTAVEFYPLIQQRISEAEESSSSSDEDMKSSYSDDDESFSNSTSSDEYSTADNSLWTSSCATTGSTETVTDSESGDKDDKTEALDIGDEELS